MAALQSGLLVCGLFFFYSVSADDIAAEVKQAVNASIEV